MRFMKIVETDGQKSIVNIDYITHVEQHGKHDNHILRLCLKNGNTYFLDGTVDEMFETIKSLGINNE